MEMAGLFSKLLDRQGGQVRKGKGRVMVARRGARGLIAVGPGRVGIDGAEPFALLDQGIQVGYRSSLLVIFLRSEKPKYNVARHPALTEQAFNPVLVRRQQSEFVAFTFGHTVSVSRGRH